MLRRIDPELTRRARELRNNPTPAEFAVWRRISRYRPAFTRQLVVEPFIIDLACREARLGIEFDGGQHHDMVEADAHRTRYIEQQGWRIIRLWNSDVLANPEGRSSMFWRRPPSASAAPTPNPSLPGRGDYESRAFASQFPLPEREGLEVGAPGMT